MLVYVALQAFGCWENTIMKPAGKPRTEIYRGQQIEEYTGQGYVVTTMGPQTYEDPIIYINGRLFNWQDGPLGPSPVETARQHIDEMVAQGQMNDPGCAS
jgi:hypothetical protein